MFTGVIKKIKMSRRSSNLWEFKCNHCGKIYHVSSNHYKNKMTRKQDYCSLICQGFGQRGSKSHHYQGGSVDKHGYKLIPVNTKQVFEHRYIMSQFLGRELLPKETVHHINGNRLDNKISNLELWSSRHPKGCKIDKNIQAIRFYSLHEYAERTLC